MAQKSKEDITLLIIPHTEKEPISIKLNAALPKFVAAGFLIAITFIGVFIQSYLFMTDEVKELKHLEELTAIQKDEIEELASQAKDLTQQMEEVKILSNQVKEILDLQDASEEDNSIGGPTVLSSRGGSREYISEENLEGLRQSLAAKYSELEELIEVAEVHRVKMDHTPSIMPVEGRITSGYGYRRSPFGVRQEFHGAIDIGASRGADVLAAASGKVETAKYNSGYGNMIIINHGNNLKTLYAHLSGHAISTGDEVEKGQVIGYVGSTGRSTGPHLHYEVHYKGESVNPINYID